MSVKAVNRTTLRADGLATVLGSFRTSSGHGVHRGPIHVSTNFDLL